MTGSKRMNDERKLRRGLMRDFILEDMHDYRVDRHSFTIYVGGDPRAGMYDDGSEPGVEHNMADRLGINLHILTGLNPKRPILIKMASCGGNVDEGMQMFDAILTCPNPITVVATKHARSMTSIIPLAADRFLLTPSSVYMYHYGTWGFYGLAGEESDTLDELRRMSNDLMMRIYVARLQEQGKFKDESAQKIRSVLEDYARRKVHVFLSGKEAKDWGFIDGILTRDPPVRARKRNDERRERMTQVVCASTKLTPARVRLRQSK